MIISGNPILSRHIFIKLSRKFNFNDGFFDLKFRQLNFPAGIFNFSSYKSDLPA